MNKLFIEFPVPGFSDWESKLQSDLKGQSQELIQRHNEIEGIQYDCYQHPDSIELRHEVPGSGWHTRGILRPTNEWINYATVDVLETEEQANKKALQFLNMGANGLRFVLHRQNNQLENLLKGIELAYIKTVFVLSHATQLEQINGLTEDLPVDCIQFELDPFRVQDFDYGTLAAQQKAILRRSIVVDGASLLQCGANSSQEIAWSLSAGHEYLVQLMDHGLTIDEACASIHFVTGTSGVYFFDLAKIRTLKRLWAFVVEQYAPQSESSKDARITGRTGFMNKSLADPRTNLLRLTTEAMSLIVGGVDGTCILPYDTYSENGITELSARMALNIPTILQEESYFDKVIDPLGGSYSVEHLTNLFSDSAWNLFQEMENAGGVSTATCMDLIRYAVEHTASIRTRRIQDKKDVLIGINIFPNPKAENAVWKPIPGYLGLPALLLEKMNTN